jgi:hypothetical protein
MKWIKPMHGFINESAEKGLTNKELTSQNMMRLFKSEVPDELDNIDGWQLGHVTWHGGIVSYFKSFPGRNPDDVVIISCTPNWEDMGDLPVQIDYGAGETEIVYIINDIWNILGVEYKKFLPRVIELIKEAFEIGIEALRERVKDDVFLYFEKGTLKEVLDFFNGDLSWHPNKDELIRKLKANEVRKKLF